MQNSRYNIIAEGQSMLIRKSVPVILNNQSRYTKVNRANAQSRPGGILFALANGKLYFEFLKIFSAPENHLPWQGAKMLPKSAFLEMYDVNF